MRILVLNGSPKGEMSVTMQYVHYIQKEFPKHELEIVHIAQRLREIESDVGAFQSIIQRVRASDGVLWAFPLYIFLVHANYKRFIELIWERGVTDAFEDKYTAALSTSIHFFDHAAHNYIRAICDDLGMRYVAFLSAEMRDLLEEEGQADVVRFAGEFFRAIEEEAPTQRAYASLIKRDFEYRPGVGAGAVDADDRRVVVVTDAEPDHANLTRMVKRFGDAFAHPIEVINLHELDIKGGCLGCLRCGYDYQCAYTGKDGYIDFYNTSLKVADVIVFAGAIKDRYLSAMWKTFFDRSFFNTHTPSLIGKQFGFIISGPLSQVPNLRQILRAYVEWQGSNLVGFVTDEYGDSASIDRLLADLAERSVRLARKGYIRPATFLGVGGMKIFRDDVWGRLRTVFQADHRAYKEMGVYDFPQRDLGVRLLNGVATVLFKVSRIREAFMSRIKEGMVQPYRRVIGE